MALQKSLLPSYLVFFLIINNGHAANPATFFWKPRLGIDLTQVDTSPPTDYVEPTRGNVEKGVVVMINGYEAGVTLMALVTGASLSAVSSTLNPLSAYFYTNVYRWALRHFSMMPQWIGGTKTYYETTELWKRRFFYLDSFVPKFLRKALPYVKQEEWDKEEREMKYFKKYAESAFGKGFRYPSKQFNKFKSWETKESKERLDMSSYSTEETQGL